MQTRISRTVRAEPRAIYELAAAVEAWPKLLPHYRWVHVQSSRDERTRTIEMAARRDVIATFGVPLRWTAVQTLYPETARIEFEHIGGITRGMQVVWTIERDAGDPSRVVVQIAHSFTPRWPLPDWLVHAVVGEYFVNGVAKRTLNHLGDLAQRPS